MGKIGFIAILIPAVAGLALLVRDALAAAGGCPLCRMRGGAADINGCCRCCGHEIGDGGP